jgi:hypothetical protein
MFEGTVVTSYEEQIAWESIRPSYELLLELQLSLMWLIMSVDLLLSDLYFMDWTARSIH